MSKAAVWTRMKLKLWGGASWQQNRAMQERNAFWDFHVSKAMVWMRIKLKRWGGTSWQQNRAMEERICILVAIYSQGLGVDQDKAEAVKWYKLAAEQGYTKAQSNLGAIYEQPIDSQPAPSNLCIFILETIEVVSGTTWRSSWNFYRLFHWFIIMIVNSILLIRKRYYVN